MQRIVRSCCIGVLPGTAEKAFGGSREKKERKSRVCCSAHVGLSIKLACETPDF